MFVNLHTDLEPKSRQRIYRKIFIREEGSTQKAKEDLQVIFKLPLNVS